MHQTGAGLLFEEELGPGIGSEVGLQKLLICVSRLEELLLTQCVVLVWAGSYLKELLHHSQLHPCERNEAKGTAPGVA